VSGAVQLTFDGLPFDPRDLAAVPILERAKLYADLGLDRFQRQAAEEACRRIIADTYGRRGA
jgi:hypothetical protein